MTKSELQELKQGDCITTKYGSIILVHHVEIKENGVYIYYFFDYDQKYKLFNGNYWLNGFYGPKFDDSFYRVSTTEEKDLIFNLMDEHGYEWDNGIECPQFKQCETKEEIIEKICEWFNENLKSYFEFGSYYVVRKFFKSKYELIDKCKKAMGIKDDRIDT